VEDNLHTLFVPTFLILHPIQKVNFETEDGPKGPAAVNVTAAE